MRITFVTSASGLGGAEINILRFLERVDRAHFQCTVATLGGRGALNRRLDEIGIENVAIGAPALTQPLHLGRALLRWRPDVVHLFGTKADALGRVLGAAMGARVVSAQRGADPNRAWQQIVLDRLTSPLVNCWIANSQAGADLVRRQTWVWERPVYVIPQGIDTVHFAPTGDRRAVRERCTIHPTRKIVVMVANIRPMKGHMTLVNAIPAIRDQVQDFKIICVGKDDMVGRVQAMAHFLGVGGALRWEGAQADVRPWLEAADLFVLPSQHEGLPTSILEAMAMGTPVIATRVGGIPEIVRDGETGLLIEPDDPEALAEAVARLLNDPDLAHRLAEAARANIRENFDMDRAVRRQLDVYCALVGTDRPRVAVIATIDWGLHGLLLNQMLAVQRAGFDVTGISALTSPKSKVAAAGIPHIGVQMSRGIDPLQDLASLWNLWRVLRRGRYTIVHTNNPKPGLIGQIAARLAGAPIVVNTVHGFLFHEHSPPARKLFWVTVERLAARCSSTIFTVSREDAQAAVREGIAPPERVKVLGGGIDVRRFDPTQISAEMLQHKRQELDLPEGAPIVGCVSRLVREKGIIELFQAAAIVRQQFPSVRFLLIGPVDYFKADALSPETAQEYGVDDLFRILSWRTDMPELYALMDVFVLPSYREGLPRVVMEAATMGVPAVVTNIRGSREVIRHGHNGLVVPVRDARALAEAIMEMLGDPDRARRMGAESRRIALEQCDEQIIFDRVIAEYARLMRDRGWQPPQTHHGHAAP